MDDLCEYCGAPLAEDGCCCNGFEAEERYCYKCDGDGLIHDCGEDTCCCLDPTMVPCPECC